MKNDLDYWEKNKEHLQKHFLDWEEFVWAERLNNRDERRSALMPLFALPHLIAFTLVGYLLFWPCLLVSFATVVALLIYYLRCMANGDFSQHRLILTTRGLYLCCGKNCEIIYQTCFSSVEGIFPFLSPTKKIKRIRVLSKEQYTHLRASSFRKSIFFQYIKNRIRSVQGKDIHRSVYSFSSYSGPFRESKKPFLNHPPLTFSFREGTSFFQPLEDILHAYPDIRYKKATAAMSGDRWEELTRMPTAILQEWDVFSSR